MASAWGYSFGAAFGNAFGRLVVAQQQSIGQGAGGQAYFHNGNRGGDESAYDADRVAQRLQAIRINGKDYDPFAPNLFEILESSASVQEPEDLPEIDRQSRKLARSFSVMAGDREIQVPMFRPMLKDMPNFKTAVIKDFEDYAARAKAEALEERRRIVILLSVH